jgi:pyruvate,water dikinase
MPYVVGVNPALPPPDIKQVGGKGAHLAELMKAGFPVPEAFFITVEAWQAFIDYNDLRERIQKVIGWTDITNSDSLDSAYAEIGKMFLKSKIPQAVREVIIKNYRALSLTREGAVAQALGFGKSNAADQTFVAVRSSAVIEDIAKASSAGQYESFLNVRGEENLMLNVVRTWASFFTPRAIYYREKQGQPQFAGMGVVVQRMVQSDKSGVTFTVDPANPTDSGANKIITEAVWGLGETIVQGLTDPDKYVVDKTNGDILDKKIGHKTTMRTRDPKTGITEQRDVPADLQNRQVLTDEEIVTIAAYGKKIEQNYNGQPQDIEWAVEKGKIYIVQTRAVTVLKATETAAAAQVEPILKGLGASPGWAAGPARIVSGPKEIDKVAEGDVLIAEMTSPDYVPAMEKSVAIVTDKGGVTSHASIVGRELGKPVIVGTQTATKVLKDGELITVDAYRGLVFEGRVEKGGIKAEEVQPVAAATAAAETPSLGIEIAVQRPAIVSIKCNIAFPETAEKAAPKADGVGLLRLEHMLSKAPAHPAELVKSGRSEELTRIITEGVSKVAFAFSPKPVWVRTIDIRTDEFRNMPGGDKEPHESNPMLGWHGIRRDLDENELFRAQVEAFKRLHEAGHTNVAIMLPFIIHVEELRRAKQLASEYGLPEGVKFGIMVETPAAALSIEEFCKEGIDFISFGSNDLAQLTLGIDRNNENLISLYERAGGEMHPAMRAQFAHVIRTCSKYGVQTSICGEAPSNRQDIVDFLIEAGISSLSVNMDAIDKAREWVRIKQEQLGTYGYG